MITEFKKNLRIGSYKSGITDYGNWIRIMSIYASTDDGSGKDPEGTDYHFTLIQDEYGLKVYEQQCGRTPGCFWTDWGDSWFGRYNSFFEVVQEIIKIFGKERVSNSRIGSIDRW